MTDLPALPLVRILALSLLAGLAAGCDILSPDRPPRGILVVDHYAQECMGVDLQLCLRVRDIDDEDFSNHFGRIEGLEYEWGYVYRLNVEKHAVAAPPADGSSIRTVLWRIEARERAPAGTEFELVLTGGGGRVEEVAPDRYRIYDSADFICRVGLDCEGLGAWMAGEGVVHLRLAHPAGAGDPLELVEWEAASPTD